MFLDEKHIFEIRFRRIERAVTQLMAYEGGHRLRGVGSGVLISLRGRNYIFTAGHVLRDLEQEHIVVGDTGLGITLSGNLYRGHGDSPDVHSRIEQDDIAWCEIDDDCYRKLSQTNIFIGVADLNLNDQATHGDLYSVWGAKGFNSKVHLADPPTEHLFLSYTNVAAPENIYRRLGYTPQRHLILEMLLKRGMSYLGERRQRTAPHPAGLSGGAIFTYHKLELPEDYQFWPKLVAIANEFRDEPGHFLIGTRIHCYIDAIRTLENILASENVN